MMIRSLSFGLLLPTIVVLALVAVACGDDEPEASATSSVSPMATMAMDGGEASFAFGHPAGGVTADRTIEIEASDTLKFTPDAVTVHVGETVTFRVHNGGAIAHEFGIGTEEDQAAHEQEMQQMAASSPGMMMQDEANAFAMMPSETKELTWTFTEAGTVLYGCHEPGHYAGGMKGTITVE
jgi:uncharacterized cupredoxin-like copper-binding protein